MKTPTLKLEATPIDVQLQESSLLRDMGDSISFTIHTRISDTDAVTTAKYGIFFIAPYPCTLVSAQEVHATAGSDGSAVTLTVEKITGTTAKGSGVTMLAGTFNLKAPANTVQTIDRLSTGLSIGVTSSILDITLLKGDRIALKPSGVLTAVNDVCVTLVFKTDLANLPI